MRKLGRNVGLSKHTVIGSDGDEESSRTVWRRLGPVSFAEKRAKRGSEVVHLDASYGSLGRPEGAILHGKLH